MGSWQGRRETPSFRRQFHDGNEQVIAWEFFWTALLNLRKLISLGGTVPDMRWVGTSCVFRAARLHRKTEPGHWIVGVIARSSHISVARNTGPGWRVGIHASRWTED
ncbi:hypothetical protein SBA3_330028 [Candidatus Sulfopaludibacter sp. SbA3]|nr:hypothetical protein SBA3_330028 [Candidatus Sulfopaludibacter sp. SbA3]